MRVESLSIVAALSIPFAILYAAWRKAPLSLTFAVVIVFVYILGYAAGVSDSTGRLSDAYYFDLGLWRCGLPGGVCPFATGHSGPWTYITSLFLHSGFFHLAFNMVFLVLFGPMLEDRIGALRWGILYVGGGIVAGLGFELVRFQADFYFLLGASGALSAIFGAFGRLYPRERIQMWIPVPLPPMSAATLVVLFIAIQAVLAVSPFGPLSGIAWEAHVIGLAFGFAAAPLAMRIPTKRAPVGAAIDPSRLERLATNRELRQILDDVRSADVPEVRAAWLEKFAAKAVCPTCGGPLRLRRNRLSSPCGWRLQL